MGDQPPVDQLPLVSDNGTAEPADTVEPPAPPVEEDNPDDIYDEPQPRNVRRRPFTSRLLRS